MKKTNWRVLAVLFSLAAASAGAQAGENKVSRLKSFFAESLSYDDFSAMYRCGQGQHNPTVEFTVTGVSKDAITIQCTSVGTTAVENANVCMEGCRVRRKAERKIPTDKLSKHHFDVRSTGAKIFLVVPVTMKTGLFDLDETTPAYPSEVPLGMVSEEAVNAALTQALAEHHSQWILGEIAKIQKESQARLQKSEGKLKTLAAELNAIMADPEIKRAAPGPKW